MPHLSYGCVLNVTVSSIVKNVKVNFTLEQIRKAQSGIRSRVLRQSSPITGLGWPRVFQEVKVPRFLDNGTGWW
jgi:hypothetical protein